MKKCNSGSLAMAANQPWILAGALSNEARFHLSVTGPAGSRELSRLVKLIEVERINLSEDDNGDDLDKIVSEEDD